MASTNHTDNYSLSQFIGTDKPAWLGDYNQDMSKIDTAMKANADDNIRIATTVSGHTAEIAGNTADIASIQSDVTAVEGRVGTLETNDTAQDTSIAENASEISSLKTRMSTVEDAQAQQVLDITALQSDVSTHTSEIAQNASDITETKTDLNSFVTKFNLTPTKVTAISGYNNIVSSCDLTLSQSDDSSFYKFYGTLVLYGGTTAKAYTKTAVQGLSGYYGIDTGLVLNVAPDEAYIVSPASMAWNYISGQKVEYISSSAFAIGTNGHIYARVSTSNSETVAANFRYAESYMPSLYINASFGDTPTPPEP